MQNYTLSERDVEILVGAAGNAVCEDHDFSVDEEISVMKLSAEIAFKLIGHLSGSEPFPEDVIEALKSLIRDLREANHYEDGQGKAEADSV